MERVGPFFSNERSRMALRIGNGLGAIAMAISISACYTIEVETVEEWCAQISGEDLYERAPFWATFPAIRFHGESLRDAYVTLLNESMLEKVQSRASRMAWRDGAVLHVENLGNLLVVDPDTIIAEWRAGIERGITFNELDQADKCLYGGITSLFDQLVVHSADHDGVRWIDETLTTIDTERQTRLRDPI